MVVIFDGVVLLGPTVNGSSGITGPTSIPGDPTPISDCSCNCEVGVEGCGPAGVEVAGSQPVIFQSAAGTLPPNIPKHNYLNQKLNN